MPRTPLPGAAAAAPPRAGYARSVETRARILAAALEEASDAGIHKTSLARIAARAGVAIGNLHYHFGSKHELLLALARSLVDDLLARLHGACSDEQAGFFEDERKGLLVYLEYLRANPAYVRLADEVKLYDPELFERAVEGWVDLFAARIRKAIDRGEIRAMSDDEIRAQAHFLLGMRQHLDHLTAPTAGASDGLGDVAAVDAYLRLIRGGLAAADRPTPERARASTE